MYERGKKDREGFRTYTSEYAVSYWSFLYLPGSQDSLHFQRSPMSYTVAMKPFVLLLVVVCFPSSILTDAGLNGPPHISGEVPPKYESKVGEVVKIECPIDGPLQVMYEWYKDREAITGTWDRFRVSKKKLRIINVSPEDGGVYVCKAVNGFGSKEISTRLIVYDENGSIVGGMDTDDTGDENNNEPDDILMLIPRIVDMSRPTTGSTFRPQKGESISLYCKVEGQPLPLVSWYKLKNGLQQLKVSGQQQLDLTSINSEDSGTYICLAVNEYGQANASFVVEVVEVGSGTPRGPVIFSLEPSNLTVVQGRLIQFRCHINSDTMPKVQWLRELDEAYSRNRTLSADEAFKQHVPGGRFELISTTSPVTQMRNGSYVSELTLRTDSRDSGSYICLATNTEGYGIHMSFLSILPPSESDSFLPIGALFAIPSTLVVLFTALALVICWVRRGQSEDSGGTPNLTITTAATYATPRDVIHEHSHHHHHQSAASLPFYKGRPQNPSAARSIPSHFCNQQYFCKEPPVPIVKNSSHPNNSAYASVPICDNGPPPLHSTFGITSSRAPPLPSRPNFPPTSRDRTSYNNQGLLTQPLLTQTASSSDSRDSRQSATYRTEFPNHRQMEHWGSSGGSDASSDRKNSRSQQIRL
ncbi:unnamed protein product [Allacma fusca]|uniref:Ig-like domain-containing protein n=1 Tax=Allacma fusca TaxID=39272 RepID=A0A8J2LEQ4_9HEXA|nr:unnamed protein product [Allacma fusca]